MGTENPANAVFLIGDQRTETDIHGFQLYFRFAAIVAVHDQCYFALPDSMPARMSVSKALIPSASCLPPTECFVPLPKPATWSV